MNYCRALGLLGMVTIVTIGTGGCGKFYWGRPRSTTEQFNQDSKDCTREASEAPGGQVVREYFDKIYRQCLTARGYARQQQLDPPPPGWHRGIE